MQLNQNMIVNLFSPKIQEIRDNIPFRDPDNLFQLTPLKGPSSIQTKDGNEFRCCICYEALVDSRQCRYCNIKFCFQCRIKSNEELISCP